MFNIFDADLDDDPRIGLYRAQVFPDLYPDESLMLIDNWSQQDREAFCGGEFAR